MHTTLLSLALLCLAAAERQSAEQAAPAKPKSVSAKGASFEAIINDLDEGEGDEAINLDGSQQFDLPDMNGWSHRQRQDWIVDNRIDLLADFANNRWALATVNVKLKAIPAGKWDTVASAELGRFLSGTIHSTGSDIEVLERGGFRYHILNRGTTVPVTFAFETSEGNLGVLQVVEFREKPRGLRFRYKLAPPTQTPRLETGPTRGTFLFVRTEPVGAEVLVDGQVVGASDDLFAIEPGVRRIIINLNGHDPEDKKVTIRAGRVTRLEMKLAKGPDSRVDLAKTIHLPRADTPNADVVLDLASGQTMTQADFDRKDFVRLGKGDLFYMFGWVGCQRGATAMLWDGESFVALPAMVDGGPPTIAQDVVDGTPSQAPPVTADGGKPIYQSKEVEVKARATGYILPTIPCRLLITTAENRHFDLTIRSATDDGGINLEYRPAHSSVVPKELLGDDEAAVREVISRYVEAVLQRDIGAVATCLANKKYLDGDELDGVSKAVSAGFKMSAVEEVHVRPHVALAVTQFAKIPNLAQFADIPNSGYNEPVCIVYSLMKQDTGWAIHDIDEEDKQGLADEIRRFWKETQHAITVRQVGDEEVVFEILAEDTKTLTLYVGNKKFSSSPVVNGKAVLATLKVSNQIQLDDGSMGHGIIYTKSTGGVSTKTFLAVTENGNLPYGEVTVRAVDAIVETTDNVTCADIVRQDGSRIPISLRLE